MNEKKICTACSTQFPLNVVNLLLVYVFSNLNRTEVELNVFDWNITAIKCYEKVGFVKNLDKGSNEK
jgi:RimJ/RimL family protein N-acetyltransferase